MASAVGRNSPLLELAGVGGSSNNRSSSLGRNSSLFNNSNITQDKTNSDKFRHVSVRPSLPMNTALNHQASSQNQNAMDSDDRESCV